MELKDSGLEHLLLIPHHMARLSQFISLRVRSYFTDDARDTRNTQERNTTCRQSNDAVMIEVIITATKKQTKASPVKLSVYISNRSVCSDRSVNPSRQ